MAWRISSIIWDIASSVKPSLVATATADWAILFSKVNLGDLFTTSAGDYGQNQAYRNRISRKHLDFLLCEPATLRPLLGIELDDSSHRRSDQQARNEAEKRPFWLYSGEK